jgi:hypothetical protein
VLSVCGNPGIIGSHDHKHTINDYGLPSFFELLFKQLMLPFEDLELLCAVVLRNGLAYKRLLEETIASPRLVEYLVFKHAGQGEIFQVKQEATRLLAEADEATRKKLEQAALEKRGKAAVATEGA